MIVPFVYSMVRVASVLTVMRLVRAWKVAVSKVMLPLPLSVMLVPRPRFRRVIRVLTQLVSSLTLATR